jgi:hypothetical protein
MALVTTTPKFGNKCKHLREMHISEHAILHFFIIFKLRSTTEQMPALVIF